MDLLKKKSLARESQDPAVLDELALDSDVWVRWYVTQNLNTNPQMLKHMAYNDKQLFVINGALSNPNIPVSVIETYSKMDETNLDPYLTSIFDNPITPKSILWDLINRIWLSNRAYAHLRSSCVHEDIVLYVRGCIMMRQMLDNWDYSWDDFYMDYDNDY